MLDFGGYSLIAIGLARVIGIKLIKILRNLTLPIQLDPFGQNGI